MEYKARKYSQDDEQVHCLLVTLCVNCTEPRDKIRARVERESVVIDFCIEFWHLELT